MFKFKKGDKVKFVTETGKEGEGEVYTSYLKADKKFYAVKSKKIVIDMLPEHALSSYIEVEKIEEVESVPECEEVIDEVEMND